MIPQVINIWQKIFLDHFQNNFETFNIIVYFPPPAVHHGKLHYFIPTLPLEVISESRLLPGTHGNGFYGGSTQLACALVCLTPISSCVLPGLWI